MRDDEKPPMIFDGHLLAADAISIGLGKIFPEWSSTRISRWLGVNPRTVQRWLKAGRGDFLDETIPADVSAKILATASHIQDIDLAGQLEGWIEMQLGKNTVDREILAAHIAYRYKRLTGRDID